LPLLNPVYRGEERTHVFNTTIGVTLNISNGPMAGRQVVGCTQSSTNGCLIATTASLYQFYTGKEEDCAKLQCDVYTACAYPYGPCGAPTPDACPPVYAGGGWHYDVAATALGIVTGKNMPNESNCAFTLTCPDNEYPGGRVDPCPDASGTVFWSAAKDLTQPQLDKVLATGPVILIHQFAVSGWTHSVLVAEKDGSNYKVWDPSKQFNPSQNWQQLSFAQIQHYLPPAGGRAAQWMQSVWGGGISLC